MTNSKEALKEIDGKSREITIEINEFKIIISDNGGGIDPKVINKIFDPYFTTKETKNGTGLGLYTAKSIVENNMGGSLTVVNTKDSAMFIIDFNDID